MSEEKKTMEVLVVEPGKLPKLTEIGSDLKSMQAVVGGNIESAYYFDDSVALVCNDSGKIDGLPLNRAMHDEDGKLFEIIAGTFFVCGLGREDFCSLPKELQKKYEDRFKQPEAFLKMGKGIMVIPTEPTDKAPDKINKPIQNER